MNTAFRRAVSLSMLLSMAACSTMQTVAQPRDFLKTHQPKQVWLSRDSGQAMIALDGPRLIGDSIVGFVEGEYAEIPVSSVKMMQAKQYSRKRTSTFLIAASAVVVGLFFIVKSGTGSDTDQIGEDDIGILPHGH